MSQLQSWARALGGSVCGRSVTCPGPGHSRDDRSLSVTPSEGAPDGFVLHSHAGDDWHACRDYVRVKLGLPRDQKRASAARQAASAQHPVQSQPDDDNGRVRAALRIWDEAKDPRGTLVEQYLKSRGLELPAEAAGEAIRFRDRCKFGDEWFQAMVCLVRNVVTNEPQGMHRTALAPNGTAIKRNGKTTLRMSLGQIAGGAIKLDPDQHVEQGLCIGEGIETCIAGMLMGYRPAWSLIAKSGIADLPILPGIDGLTIFAERDENQANEKAIQVCAERWLAAGINVETAWPLIGNDLKVKP